MYLGKHYLYEKGSSRGKHYLDEKGSSLEKKKMRARGIDVGKIKENMGVRGEIDREELERE
jgi:hypothetical protein